MNQDIEKSFVCETYLENVFEIPALQQEIRKAWAEALQNRPRRKKTKAEIDMPTMLKIHSALGRLIKVEDELHYVRGQFEQLAGKMERARAAYSAAENDNPANKRASHKKRLSLMAHALDFTTGKRPKSINSSGLYWDYVSLRSCGSMVLTEGLLRGDKIEVKPMTKREAIPILQKKYKQDTEQATDKALSREIAKRRARGSYIPEGY